MTKVLVTGDISVDHNLYLGERKYPKAQGKRGTIMESTIGGFYLLHDILKSSCNTGSSGKVTVYAGIKKPRKEKVALSHHGYITWKKVKKSKGAETKEGTWYIDSLLGYGIEINDEENVLECTEQNNLSPDILVIDEAALGFRQKQELWPQCLKNKDNGTKSQPVQWVVYKMAYPVMRDSLWAALHEKFKDRLVLVVAAEDLRRDEIKVSSGGSWEKTIQDLVMEVKQNPLLRSAKNCKHLVVTFKSEGALVFSDIGESSEVGRFVFDPAYQEGQWTAENAGEVVGYGACVTAGIVKHLADGQNDNLEDGVKQGLAAARDLLIMGHGEKNGSSGKKLPGFPCKSVSRQLQAGVRSQALSCVKIDTRSLPTSAAWSLLNEQAGNSKRPLYGIARLVARNGAQFIKTMPYGKFGKLLTVDRGEIESLNSIRQLVLNYVHKDKDDKPLSIGVFGPPGAGKSFGIKQIVRGIMPNCKILEYNLSQYELGPQTLIGMLHQVRDEVLRGETPLVFWDEFDSQKLAWLQYLLAPMQDGCFLDGQQIHPIGKCIFVFAGGTASSMDVFSPDIEGGDYKEFRLKKGPDFVSRLHGYLNVLGPNQREINEEFDPEDIFFPIRRALLLRSMVELYGDEELEIDSGILSAFLKIDKYKHGARSLETVLKQMKKSDGLGLYRSNLPPQEQIGLHVDYERFCRLVSEDSVFHAQTERLAPEIHDHYRKKTPGGEHSDKKYKDLSPDIQESNLTAAMRIPEIMAFAGMKLVDPGTVKSPLDDKEINALLERNLELLAEAEHKGWMKQKELNGWKYSEVRDDSKRLHPALLPYAELDQEDKQKDRDSVLNYPEIARKAGFIIVYDVPSEP